MRRFISNIAKSNLFIVTCYGGFLFVALQCLSFDLAGAQTTNATLTTIPGNATTNATLTTIPGNATTNETEFVEAQTTNEIEYVYNIEQMKGHLEQAVTNKENGNNSLTRAHIQHPIVEIYDFIKEHLAAADSNLNTLLFNSLNELSDNVEKLDLSQFKRETDEVNQMLNNASDLIVPEDNSTLDLIAASWLLDAANTEYESGVRNGKVMQVVEYQDAIGFISRAESLLNDTLPMLNQSMKISADQAKSLFPQLNLKVQAKADIKDIQTSTNEIKQKISNITGLY